MKFIKYRSIEPDQHDGKLSKREQNVYLNSLINKI